MDEKDCRSSRRRSLLSRAHLRIIVDSVLDERSMLLSAFRSWQREAGWVGVVSCIALTT